MTDMFAPIVGDGRPRRADAGADWTPITPVPDDAPRPPAGHRQKGRPSMVFTYRNGAGEVLGYVCRFEEPGGGKIYQPLTFCQDSDGRRREWRWKGWLEPRPLYNLDALAFRPNATVVVVEGEKAADAAARLLPDYVAVTSPNGSKSAAKAQWGSLARRHVVVWPDADGPGAEYAAAVVRAVQGVAAASVSVITPPTGVKEGWDAADAEADGWTTAQALELVKGARTVGGNGGDDDEAGGRRRQRAAAVRDSLVELVAGAELWHTPDREAFASVPVNGHIEHWQIKGSTFQDWLAGEYYERCQAAASDQAVKEAISALSARAIHSGPEYQVFLRNGFHDGCIYIDLGDREWRAVRVGPDGWNVVDRPPVKFWRPNAMRPLPMPNPEGCIEDIDHGLREIMNFGSEADFRLLVAWLLAALNPNLACPILAINGEQGSSKSTMSTLMRSLVDPNIAPIRAAPSDEQNFVVMAINSRVMVLDNLSDVPGWLSDALCRLTTGGGFSARKLFSDRDEVVFHIKRPIVLNGIPELARRPDLADRCLMITLPPIPEDRRCTEEEFWAKFNDRQPFIFGALLDALAYGLRRLPSVHLATLPRMADFAKFVTAAGPALGWAEGDIMDAYSANRAGAVQSTIEADPLAAPLRELVEFNDWEGTATELLSELERRVTDSARKGRLWPTANSLRSRLLRLQAPLRTQGIVLDLDLKRAATKDRSRLIGVRMPARS